MANSDQLAPTFADMLTRNGIGVSDAKLTLLPEPELRPVFTPFISVDDHALEPPDLFTSRAPERLRDRVPHVDMTTGRPAGSSRTR